MSINLKETFPEGPSINCTGIVQQHFTVDDSEITIVTYVKNHIPGIEPIICAGIITDGHFEKGYFQRRGYIGNPLKDKVISPIMPIKRRTVYDLTLDNTVTSFSFNGEWKRL